MKIRPTLMAAALALAALLPASAGAEDDPRVDAADYTFALEIDAPLTRVWDLFTTVEGLESWAVPHCEADFRAGGTLKTHYGRGEIGDENTIVHHIDSVVPYEMYASRVTPPGNGGIMKLLAQTNGVTTFDEVLPDRTRVVIRSFGWGEGDEWDSLRRTFDAGNAWTLQRLRALVPDRDRKAEVQATLQALGKLCGDWIGEAEMPGGQTMRIHTRVAKGPAERSFTTTGTMRVGDRRWLHSAAQLWVAPGAIALRFRELSDDGGTAHGTVTLEASSAGADDRADDEADGVSPEAESAAAEMLVWDWTHVAPDGTDTRYRVEQVLEGADAYAMRLLQYDGEGGLKELMTVGYRRVDEVPEEFTR